VVDIKLSHCWCSVDEHVFKLQLTPSTDDSFTVPSLQQTAQLYRVEDWVAVRYEDDWYIGIITALNMEEVEVNCMRRVDKSQNQFTWPRVRDCTWYVKSNILCTIPPPTPITRRRTAFVLSKEDQAKIMGIWKDC
jgi:hypothetical protein